MRMGWEQDRRTRVSKSRMYSTSSLGFAILRNKETSATCPHHETFYIPKRNKHHCSMTLDNCISALVDICHTDVFTQDEVQDARKDTRHHHFGSHGRTYTPKYRNFADCDPLVSVCLLDDNTTATSAIDLAASIPEAT